MHSRLHVVVLLSRHPLFSSHRCAMLEQQLAVTETALSAVRADAELAAAASVASQAKLTREAGVLEERIRGLLAQLAAARCVRTVC